MLQELTACYSTPSSLKGYGEHCSSSWRRGVNRSRYPKGGFYRVLDALLKVSQRYGVEYRFSKTVSKINISDGGQATGVTLNSGETMYADIVLVNADLVYAYSNLLPGSREAKSLSKKPSSCSSISFYCEHLPTVL
jgi:phytoene dehydrogenase-like protein